MVGAFFGSVVLDINPATAASIATLRLKFRTRMALEASPLSNPYYTPNYTLHFTLHPQPET